MNKKKIYILFALVILVISILMLKGLIYDKFAMNKFKKEIVKQASNLDSSKTLEDKFKQSWYENNSDTKLIKTITNNDNQDMDKEFTVAYLEDNIIKIAVISSVKSQDQINFIEEKNIITDGQKLIDLKYIKFKGNTKPFLLVEVASEGGIYYLGIYDENYEELLKVDGNGGIILKGLTGEKEPQIIPITNTGETPESSFIDVYIWNNKHFIHEDAKNYVPKKFSTPENIIKYFFKALRQGNYLMVKDCFSKEVQRNFSDSDFNQLARLYQGNAALINLAKDSMEENRINVNYKSNVTKGNIDINLIQEKGNWLINDRPSMLIPGKTKFNG